MKTARNTTNVVPLSRLARPGRLGRVRRTLLLGSSTLIIGVALANAQTDRLIARSQVVATSSQCPVILVNFSVPVNLGSHALSGDGQSLVVRLALPEGSPAPEIEGAGIETQPDLALAGLGSAQMKLDTTGADPLLNVYFSSPVSARATQSGTRSIVIALSTVGDTQNCFAGLDAASTETPASTSDAASAAGGDTVQAPCTPPSCDSDEASEAETLLSEARAAITAEDYPAAIRILTKLQEMPENPSSPAAQELLGVVRERNGQMAHATAEYETYLEKYGDSEGADRVRQRLAAILTAQSAPPPALRAAGEGPALAPRVVDGVVQQPPQITSIPREEDTFRPLGPQPGFSGDGDVASFEQAEEEDQFRVYVSGYYYLNQSSTVFTELQSNTTDDDDELLQNAFVLGFDASDERKVGSTTMSWRINGDYEFDLVDPNNSGLRLSRMQGGLAFENGAEITVGRQTLYEAGVLGRFDGLSASYPIAEDFVANGVVGLPVDSTKDTLFSGNRTMLGASVDYLGFGEDTDLSGYVIEELREGYRDRFAVGLEGSYIDEKNAVFGGIEYAPDFARLNNVRLAWTRQLNDDSSLSASFDYRQSPYLSLTTALQGQTVTSLSALSNSFSLAQMENLAKDRSSEIASATFGYQLQLTDDWLASTDATFTYTTGNPASGGVPANPAPGFEMYASAQATGTGIILDNDAVNIAGRYANTASSDLYLLDTYWRFNAFDNLRLKPRVQLAHRQLTSTGGYENFAIPSITFYYDVTDTMDFELETGSRMSYRRTSTTKEKSNEFYLFAGVSQEF